MVNELTNNRVPWQSTVPQQMPWMSPYESGSSNNLQFGQPINDFTSVGVFSGIHVPPGQFLPNLTLPDSSLSNQINTCVSPPYGPVQPNFNQPQASGARSPLMNQLEPSIINLNQAPNYPVSATEQRDYIGQIPLTYMPALAHTSSACPQKRTSIEMEDDQLVADEPPTKQLLSESKLFKQFGSLHLNPSMRPSSGSSSESDDSDEEIRSQNRLAPSNDQSREELNRYVYLLFKDKNQGDRPFIPENSTLDRLAREERDKLSKAVILWTPPPNHNLFGQDDTNQDSSDDDELSYSDHTDFLKKSPNDSLTITEVFDSPPRDQACPDEMMLD